MKILASMVACLICIMILFAGCNKKENINSSLEFSFDSEGNYEGFNDMPSDYTPEMAQKDGYFVKGYYNFVANESLWDQFLTDSSRGNDASIRIVKFYASDELSYFFTDLFYRDGYYYIFESSAESLEKKPYEHLLKLEGSLESPLEDSGVFILTNDDTLTFDTVVSKMISSSFQYIQSIPEFRIIMFF